MLDHHTGCVMIVRLAYHTIMPLEIRKEQKNSVKVILSSTAQN